jgi:membrane fusion protein (multidrug efflux system)
MSEVMTENGVKNQEIKPEKISRTKNRNKAFAIFFIVLALLAAAGTLYWLHARQFEETDDAEIEAHLNPVTSRIDGTITRVYVDNNQTVKAGDSLVDLDPRDMKVALDQAQAQAKQAISMVAAQQPNIPITQVQSLTSITTAEADVATAQAKEAVAAQDQATAAARVAESKANYTRALQDLERYKVLIAKEEISQQEFDQAAATVKAQAAAVDANEAALQSAARTVDQRKSETAAAVSRLGESTRTAPAQLAIRRANVASEQASAQTAAAELEQAKLKLSYTQISAQVPGIVMKRSAEVGAHIAAGQQLMTIAQVNDVWVTANYKETQLENIRPNQSALIHVDALKRDFEGYVEDIGASTGAISSVLPPENATGNYVKVVQRIPVRLRFKKDQKGLEMLRPGMSVVPQIRIGG